jgi:hypothetical protein
MLRRIVVDEKQVLAFLKLKLQIDTPNLEEIWLEGYDCAKASPDEERNPYLACSQEFNHWEDGWWAGCYGQAALFDLSGNINSKALAPNNIIDNIFEQMIAKLHAWFCSLGQLISAVVASIAAYAFTDLF